MTTEPTPRPKRQALGEVNGENCWTLHDDDLLTLEQVKIVFGVGRYWCKAHHVPRRGTPGALRFSAGDIRKALGYRTPEPKKQRAADRPTNIPPLSALEKAMAGAETWTRRPRTRPNRRDA